MVGTKKKGLVRGPFRNLLKFSKKVSYAGIAIYLAVMYPYSLEGLYDNRMTLCEL